MADDRAILVIGPAWVGDMVMAQGLFRVLRDRHPHRSIDVMAPAWAAGLLARMPEVRDWIDAPFRHGQLGFAERFRAGLALRHRYALAFVLPGSWKSALVPFFAGVPRRIGYRREWRYGLLTVLHPVPREGRRRTAAMFARLAGGSDEPVPRLAVDPVNRAALLARHGLAGPLAALMPGAEYGPAKRWPARHFAGLARALLGRGMTPVLLGSPQDRSVAGVIAALAPGAVDLCGRTRIEDAIDLLGAAAVAVSNDSGLMHVAAAVGTPIVGLFGSTSPDHTPPLSDRSAVLTLRLPCSPCHDRVCRLGHTACLEALDVEPVLAAVDRLIRVDA